ncbi:MAG: ABC transporter permease [Glycocaulis sp.]
MTAIAAFAPLHAEIAKLRRSLSGLMVLAAPVVLAVFTFANMVRLDEPRSWDSWLQGTTAIWAQFMLPMSMTAITVLAAQAEHGPRSWDYLRALPLPRWRLYASKAVMVMGLGAAMTALVALAVPGAAMLAGLAKPAIAASGGGDIAAYAASLGKMLAASTLLVAIQLWVALRFASFAPALATGIAGTFFALTAWNAQNGIYFPWLMPINTLADEPGRAGLALALGGAGGVAVFAAMTAHLSVREHQG